MPQYKALRQLRGAFGSFEPGDDFPADAPGLDDLIAARAVEPALPAGAKVERAVAVPPEPEPFVRKPEPEPEPEPAPEPEPEPAKPKPKKKAKKKKAKS